jgi:hypothetical protein
MVVVNDHGNHDSGEPTVDLPLTDFVAMLRSVEPTFRKIN